jgi:Gpi18-like mannosyltransferase
MVSSYVSADYQLFLKPWMSEIVANGRILSLSIPIGNYTPPYVYLLTILSYFPSGHETDPYLLGIKLISILFDLLLAYSVYLNATLIFKNNSKLFASIVSLLVFLLPTVFLNSAFWGQIDASYTAFGLISLYYLQKRQLLYGMTWLSIALSFKLQAIFFIPVFIIYVWFYHRKKWFYFFLIPLIYMLLVTPTFFFGRDFIDVMTIYMNQVTTYRALTLNMPNMWMWFANNYDSLYLVGIVIFVVIMGLFFLSLKVFKIKPPHDLVLLIGLFSILTANYFLPSMHERYLYSADIISVLVAIQFTSLLFLPLSLQFISSLAYAPFLFQISVIPLRYVSLVFLLVLLLVYHFTFVKLKQSRFIT